MIKVENIEVWGFEHAIRGMRNPLNSWDRSDSYAGKPDCFENCSNCTLGEFFVGENDIALMRKLYAAGQPHRKYLRQIFVSMDITAPLYWWKEFDTYKVGTVANSCSTMHKIADKEFTLKDFSHEHLDDEFECIKSSAADPYVGDFKTSIGILLDTIEGLNWWRNQYLHQKEIDAGAERLKWCWWQLIQLLPSSYNQRRTVTMTYENVMNMLDYREGHKLDEWREFCKILKQLPYADKIRDNRI